MCKLPISGKGPGVLYLEALGDEAMGQGLVLSGSIRSTSMTNWVKGTSLKFKNWCVINCVLIGVGVIKVIKNTKG